MADLTKVVETCDYRLAAGLKANCANKTTKGLRNRGYIINYDDIDLEATTRSASNPNIYEAVVLKTGKKAYPMYVPGSAPFTGTKKSLVKGTYRSTFTKTVVAVILDNGPGVAKDVIDQLANGTFVVILENKFGGADGKNTFEIYGIENGLYATALDDDKYSEDTEGGWTATLEETGAPSSGLFLFNESLAATRTALESLTNG